MAQKTTLRCAVVCVLVLSFGVFSVIGTGIGIISVNGTVWTVGEADDVGIGHNESQTINDIKIRGGDKDIKIEVGNLVERGAEFDGENSSYSIADRQNVNDSEVYIRNQGKENATIVVNKSLLDGERFDVKISNIDTRNVGRYDNKLSLLGQEIEYLVKQDGTENQDGTEKPVQFEIHTSAEISIQNKTNYNDTENITLENLELINKTDHVVIWEQSEKGRLVQQLGSSQGSEKEINITNGNVSGDTELAATIHPGEKEPNTDVIYAANSRSVQFPILIQTVQKPVHYLKRSPEQGDPNSVVSLPFNTNISSQEGEISVKFFNRSLKTINIGEDTEQYRIDNNRVDILLNSTVSKRETSPYVERISANQLKSEDYKSEYSETEYSPQRVKHTIKNKTDIIVEQGSYIRLNSSKNDTISLSSEEQKVHQTPIRKYGKYHVINTTTLSEGEYVVQSESEINQTQITLVNTSLSPTVPTTSIENGIVAKFESSPTTRHIITKIRMKSEVNKEETIIDNQNQINNSINISESGKYEMKFLNINTGEKSSKNENVLKERDLTSDTPIPSEHVAVGQKFPVNISSTYNTTFVEFINKTTNSTTATIELATPEAGQTSLGINTYAAANGSLNESVTVTGPGSSIESVTTARENGTLSPGTYEIAIRSEQGIATTSDNATVTLSRRSTNGLTTYGGTEANRSELRSAAAVRDAINDDTLSRSERVGANDTVVYAVNATGLTGLTAARNATPETGADLDRLDGLEFAVRPTGEEGDLVTSDASGETPRDAMVHVDEAGLYVVADGEDALPVDDGPEPGEEFTAEFRVTDDRLREAAADPPDGHSVTSTITYAGTDSGGSSDGDAERIESGDPADGGRDGESGGIGDTGGSGNTDGSGTTGGSGSTGPSGDTGGNGNSGGSETTNETTGTGNGTGNATGGTDLDAPVGGDRPDEPNADNGITSGNGDRTGPLRGIGFGSRPNSDGPTPALDEPIAVSAPTATAGNPLSGSPESEASSSGIEAAPGETGGEADSATERAAGGDAAETEAATESDAETDGAEPAATGSERTTPTYENAPIRTTAEDLPGFGAIQSLTALSLVVLSVTRRLRPRS